MKKETKDLLGLLNIKNPQILAFVSEIVEYGEKNSNKATLSQADSNMLSNLSTVVTLATTPEKIPAIKYDNNSALYSIAQIAQLALTKTKSYGESKSKSRAIKTMSRAVMDITRNTDKSVFTIVCSTQAQRDLAFAVSNIEGVTDSLKNARDKFWDNDTDSKDLDQLLKTHREITKNVGESSDTLNKLITDCLIKGHGSRIQLSRYVKDIFDEKQEDIIKDIKAGESIEKISKTYKIDKNTLIFVLKDTGTRNSLINERKDEILKEVSEKNDAAEIIKLLKFDESFLDEKALITYIGQWQKEINASKNKKTEKNRIRRQKAAERKNASKNTNEKKKTPEGKTEVNENTVTEVKAEVVETPEVKAEVVETNKNENPGAA